MFSLCRQWSALLSLTLIFLVFARPLQAAERASEFHSDITVQEDTSLTISERLVYTTTEPRHGIYRYIPIRYQRGGMNIRAEVSEVRVTDEKGNDIPFEKKRENGSLFLKIGDPDKTFAGEKIYVITYRVQNAVFPVSDTENPEKEHPELYWDITGEGWQFELASISATVRSPNTITKTACYTGVYGSSVSDCSMRKVDNTTTLFHSNQPVGYGENFTVAVVFAPESGIVLPTKNERRFKQFLDNLEIVLLLFPAGILFLWWWKRGRDMVYISGSVHTQSKDIAQQRMPFLKREHIPFVYEPLSEVTPGEAGALYDEKVDIQDVIAEITDLARKKFLKIERQEKKKFLGKDVDYVFTRLTKSSESLPIHQAYLLEHLFEEKETVALSELKGTFLKHVEETKKRILSSLVEKKYFLENPQASQGKAFAAVFILHIVTFLWLMSLFERGIYWAGVTFGVSSIVSLVCAYLMPAKSAEGHKLAKKVRGLKQSIGYGAWREKIKEKNLFFEEVLPFAIALGVADKLTKDMKALDVKPPEYLDSYGFSALGTQAFVHDFTTKTSQSLTYNPNSSSWSGGSGSSGGFSGGGGGGGGGGSW